MGFNKYLVICYVIFYYNSTLLFQNWRVVKAGCLCLVLKQGLQQQFSSDSLHIHYDQGMCCDFYWRNLRIVTMEATSLTRLQASFFNEKLSMENSIWRIIIRIQHKLRSWTISYLRRLEKIGPFPGGSKTSNRWSTLIKISYDH